MHRLALAALCLVLPSIGSASIVLNEMLPNPVGDDVGTERLEIYNDGVVAVDVTGWAIDDAATIDEVGVRARIPEDFDTSVCSGSALIGPGERRVVKGITTAAFLNNGGDDVYLVSDRTVTPNVVDAVTYPSASAQVGQVWACVPDGSENFAWRAPSFCASNGGGGDATPPATITDLVATPGAFPGEVVLSWTAPGDDGMTGASSEYVIKVSTAPITDVNFDAATDLEFWVNEPAPHVAGTQESVLVAGMDDLSTYFFAVRAVDDASNESAASNDPSVAPASGERLDTNFGLSTYFGNLHSHTSFSDGVGTPADAYAYARFTAPTPLDFLAVTDHNHASANMSLPNYDLGRAQAVAATVDGSFVGLYGQEFGLATSGHVIVLESPSLFGWDAGNYDVFVAEGDYAALYTAAVQNPPADGPAVALWAHPQSGDFDNLQIAPDSDVVSLICLVNGPANSTATDESDVGNTGFDDTFQDALRIGHRVSPTADQDNHEANWGASTQSRTGVLATELTRGAILGALAEGRNYATQDHNARVGLSAEGRKMGEPFTSAAGIRLAVEVDDPDPSETIAQIEVYRGVTGVSNAVRVAYNVGNTRLEWRDTSEYADGTEVHYYVRVRQGDAQQIWTAPVYVTYDAAATVAELTTPSRLLSVRPNPMRERAEICFTMPPADGPAHVDVLDAAGRIVRRIAVSTSGADDRRVEWNGAHESGRAVGPGVYFVRLVSARSGARPAEKVIVVR